MSRLASFKVPVQRPVRRGPETLPHYWHPNRVGAGPAPTWFTKQLRQVDPDGLVQVCWNPIRERWQVWYRAPRVTHQLCPGWLLLFIVQNPDGSYRPLDERTLARLFEVSSQKWGNARAYWLAVEREIERDRERRERQMVQDTIDLAMPSFEHSQIKVSMRGASNGSKFSTYHA